MSYTPLYAVAPSRRDTVAMSDVRGALLHYSIPALEATGEPELVSPEDVASAKLRLRGGEVMVSRLNPRKGRVIRVPAELSMQAFASTEFVVLVPQSVEPRYLAYLLESEAVRQDLDSRVRSVTRSHQRVEPEAITQMRVDLPAWTQQQRIADFLDDQVTRIEKIIEARNRQMDLLESERVALTTGLFTAEPRLVPMRRLIAEAVVGIVVQPSRYYTLQPDGVPALRGLDVTEGAIAPEGHVLLTTEGHLAHPRSRLRRGDVVVVRTGDAGAAAEVPDWADGWNCIDLVVARPNHLATSGYLECTINAARLGARIGAVSSGSIQQHFGVGALLDYPVPMMELVRQEGIATEVRRLRTETARVRSLLRASIDLLSTCKASLIASAVSGVFDVSTADGRGVPA